MMMIRHPFVVLVVAFSINRIVDSVDWVDIDTPPDMHTITSLIDGTIYSLVMSDEFNVDNRTFKDGDDPMWTALDKSDDDASSVGGGSLQFYNSSAVTTENGFLKISTYLETTAWNRYDEVKKVWKHEIKNFTSGMVQSWNKFCFTGGIVEVDVIFPGDPYIGGLWPAIWMLGNLGRATYEASTNNIWPWSYDTCDRGRQQAQTFSACNAHNHFGMHPFRGRGATEIDIVEVMTGSSDGALRSTFPPIEYPYADFTLQVAPGIPNNRPQSGSQPLRKNILSKSGHTEFLAQTWYEGLEMKGNTSINPFFYGTYLAETKPNEPVTRNKMQAFQADAVGVMHQLTPSHFRKPHTIRLEWQPGRGGRLDWFVKSYKLNDTDYMEGDGLGDDWLHAFSLKDESLRDLMGSQIPIEPSYLIMNTAVSSTWGFPYDVPEYCQKCYDCLDPRCACSFYPGFCRMLQSRKTAMYIDYIRIYQSKDHSAHVGAPHTLGCDPPEYPTRGWIEGNRYRYIRNPPFSYQDRKPIRDVRKGGGPCTTDNDCGGDVQSINFTYASLDTADSSSNRALAEVINGRGNCVFVQKSSFLIPSLGKYVCSCRDGFTGPHCLALDHVDEYPSAYKEHKMVSPFHAIYTFRIPQFLLGASLLLITLLLASFILKVWDLRKVPTLRNWQARVMVQNGDRPMSNMSDNASKLR